jgi:hypothetical protein
MQVNYQPTTDKFKIDFGQVMVFPNDMLDAFFKDAEAIGIINYGNGQAQITQLTCTEEQWAKFVQFRRDCEKDNPPMYHQVDAELNAFLFYALQVRPQACVLQ